MVPCTVQEAPLRCCCLWMTTTMRDSLELLCDVCVVCNRTPSAHHHWAWPCGVVVVVVCFTLCDMTDIPTCEVIGRVGMHASPVCAQASRATCLPPGASLLPRHHVGVRVRTCVCGRADGHPSLEPCPTLGLMCVSLPPRRVLVTKCARGNGYQHQHLGFLPVCARCVLCHSLLHRRGERLHASRLASWRVLPLGGCAVQYRTCSPALRMPLAGSISNETGVG